MFDLSWKPATITKCDLQIDRGFIIGLGMTFDYADGTVHGLPGMMLSNIQNLPASLEEANHLHRWLQDILRLSNKNNLSSVAGTKVYVLSEHARVHAIRSIDQKHTFWITPDDKPKDIPTTMEMVV